MGINQNPFMNTLLQRTKTYAAGALLVMVLLSPLQSSAAMMTMREVNTFREQITLVSEAIESSTAIPLQKKNELRAVVESLNDLVSLLALQAASNLDAMYERPVYEPEYNPASPNAQAAQESEDPRDNFTIQYD